MSMMHERNIPHSVFKCHVLTAWGKGLIRYSEAKDLIEWHKKNAKDEKKEASHG